MKLNTEKSKIMMFNFTKKYQFIARIYMEDKLLEIVKESTVLGLIIYSDLSWKKNTEKIISKANTSMILIRRLIRFPVEIKDLVMLYGQFIRSILEFNSNVWFSSITQEECNDIGHGFVLIRSQFSVQNNQFAGGTTALQLKLIGQYIDHRLSYWSMSLF